MNQGDRCCLDKNTGQLTCAKHIEEQMFRLNDEAYHSWSSTGTESLSPSPKSNLFMYNVNPESCKFYLFIVNFDLIKNLLKINT